MARNFNGGTDHIYVETAHSTDGLSEAISLWIKTTQTTVNACVASRWSGTSRNGWGLLINNTANKVSFVGYSATTQRLLLASSVSINGGGWVHIGVNMQGGNGATNTIYINGASDGSQNSSALWADSKANFLQLGDQTDAFWPTYVGDIAEVAVWWNTNLTAAGFAALAAGFSPRAVRAASLVHYLPLVNDATDFCKSPYPTVVGTTVTDHPRIIY